MPQQVTKSFELQDVQPGQAERTLIAVASTAAVDRAGDVVEPGGWVLDRYLQNPVILWNHDLKQLPVAKALRVWVENDALMFEAQFPPEGQHPFADLVYGLYRDGFLRAFSVRIKGLDTRAVAGRVGGVHYLRQELMEISACPVGVNPEALLVTAKSLGATEQSLTLLITPKTQEGEESMNWLEKIKSLLGLAPEADEQAVETAVKNLKALAQGEPIKGLAPVSALVLAELGLAQEAGENAVLGAIKGLRQGRDQSQELAGKVAALEKDRRERDAAEAVAKALGEGKISPAQRDWATDYAGKDLEGFKAYVAAAPQVVPVSDLPGQAKAAGGQSLDEVQKSINAQLGISKEVFDKHAQDKED